MSVLITDASKRAALAAIRSIGSKGVEVTAASDETNCAGFLSKYATHKVIMTNPQVDSEKFLDEIEKELRVKKQDCLFPIHDFSLIPVLKEKKRFDALTSVPFCDFKTFEKTWDKEETLKVAKLANVPIPKTMTVTSVKEVEKLSDVDFEYPVVVKPASQTQLENKGAKTSYVSSKNYCHSIKDVQLIASQIVSDSGKALIQEYIQGNGVGVAALFNKGKPRALFSYKRVREYPITGGPSTLRKSTNDEKLKEYASNLLEKLKWHGLAMVEFKQTPTGKYYLMEINGRFWGSVALAINSGVDFPYLLYEMGTKGDVEEVTTYKVGVLQKWLLPGDVLHFGARFKKEKFASKPGVALDFVKSIFEPASEDYLSLDDPLPAFGALKTGAGYFANFLAGKRTMSGEYKKEKKVKH